MKEKQNIFIAKINSSEQFFVSKNILQYKLKKKETY